MSEGRAKRTLVVAWPWLVMVGFLGLAAWHVLDYSDFEDTEFPRVVRSYFNPMPPAAYRLAEPGDTLDRVGLYLAAIAVTLASAGLISRWRTDTGYWPAGLAASVACLWHAATPGPCIDGWHGLGWRVVMDASAPMGLRLALALAAVALVAMALAPTRRRSFPGGAGLRARFFDFIPSKIAGTEARSTRKTPIQALLFVSAALISLRQVEIPGMQPAGYWPRVSFDLGVLALVLAMIEARPMPRFRPIPALGVAGGLASLVVLGVLISLSHRPLARLKVVVPGRIYLSAMPTYRGLAIEQGRLHFKTIINLFDEASTQASPHHDDEIRFVREHGLRYLGSPSDGMESDRFLDETLAIARDPNAWPILVHCHGCVDRSPAWMGMYRFLVEGKPLDQVMAEIERHRGSRPKAVVTLLFKRKLPPRAPDRFAADPTGQLLIRNAGKTKDPFDRPNWNKTATGRGVVTRIDPDRTIRRP